MYTYIQWAPQIFTKPGAGQQFPPCGLRHRQTRGWTAVSAVVASKSPYSGLPGFLALNLGS